MKDLSRVSIDRAGTAAEKLYGDGDFFCSEAVVKSIRDEFGLDITDEIIAAASGFPVGIGGCGCVCGALSGGVMMLGLFFGRTRAGDEKVNLAMRLSAELHRSFIDENNSLCCSVLTGGMDLGSPEHMEQCVSFTGDVARKTAEIILRERSKVKPGR